MMHRRLPTAPPQGRKACSWPPLIAVLVSCSVAALGCGGVTREALQLTRVPTTFCQQSGGGEEICETLEDQRQRLPAILESDNGDLARLTISDPDQNQDLTYPGQFDGTGWRFVIQLLRQDPQTLCRFNHVDTIDLNSDGELFSGQQELQEEQSAACTTTGESLLTRTSWRLSGHRLALPNAVP